MGGGGLHLSSRATDLRTVGVVEPVVPTLDRKCSVDSDTRPWTCAVRASEHVAKTAAAAAAAGSQSFRRPLTLSRVAQPFLVRPRPHVDGPCRVTETRHTAGDDLRAYARVYCPPPKHNATF